MDCKMRRRGFLQGLGAGAGVSVAAPVSALLETMVEGMLRKASAQTLGTAPRQHLMFFFGGGPPRWAFDLFLNPQGQSGLIPAKQIATRYAASGGRYVAGEYATTKVRGVEAPWLWQFGVPSATGGNRPMTDLMDNMMVLQGINALQPNHPQAQEALFAPLGAKQSLPALSADASDRAFKAINVGIPHPPFRLLSKHGYTPTFMHTNDNNWIQVLLFPVTKATGSGFNASQSKVSTQIKDASLQLAAAAQARHPAAAALEKNRADAADMMQSTLGSFAANWQPLFDKYLNLIMRALDPSVSLPGINDLPVGTAGARNKMYEIQNIGIVNTPDLRSMIDASTYTLNRIIAADFAFAEFVMKNRLTHSLTIGAHYLRYKINGGTYDLLGDEHVFGVMPSLYAWSYYWRMHSACLIELISQLKAAGVFNDTLISQVGDFGRCIEYTDDGQGSGHNPWGSTAVFHSGAIQGPHIHGNVLKSGQFGVTDGSGDGSRDYGHLLSTIAHMLRVPSPLTARSSLVSESGGSITSSMERTALT